jgi:hypothetical protein
VLIDDTASVEPPAGALPAALGPRPPSLTLWPLWLTGFLCAALVAASVQMIVLPYVVPELHAGDGLLEGLDAQAFHGIAVERARRIRAEGWNAWQLRPLGQAPAGIASAIYAVSVPEPWTLIPLNAALHVTAALVLLLIVERLVGDRRVALLAVLPFFFYPSAMTWYTQLHKEGPFILGSLLFIWGWVELARSEAWWGGIGAVSRWVIVAVLGVLCSYVAREYSALILGLLARTLALGLTLLWVWRVVAGRVPWRVGVPAVVGAWLVVAVLVALTWEGGGKGVSSEMPPSRPTRRPPAQVWVRSTWLPWTVDGQLKELARVRDGFRVGYPEAGTNVDLNVGFQRASDVVSYLPRAAALGLLSPFPDVWLGSGTVPGGTVMRRVVGLETLGLYVALAFLPLALWRWRTRVEAYVIAICCLFMTVLYATAICNVGALYRFRYGFVMTLAALGLAVALASRPRRPATGDAG